MRRKSIVNGDRKDHSWTQFRRIALAAVAMGFICEFAIGQTSVRPSPEDSIYVAITQVDGFEEDVNTWTNLLDRQWLEETAVQIGWGWRSYGSSPSSLGSPRQWQMRASNVTGRWSSGFVLDKDMAEPWGKAAIPWRGPELKRWRLARYSNPDQSGRHVLLGLFRVNHGFGLASGARRSVFPSRGNPLRLPGKLASARSYAGTVSGAVRMGAMVGLEGRYGVIRFWQSSHRATASTRSLQDIDGLSIQDVSGTSSFTSESSLKRRNALRLQSTGIQTVLGSPGVQVALLAEHIRTRLSRDWQDLSVADDEHTSIELEMPASMVIGSVSYRISVRSISWAHEAAFSGGWKPNQRLAIRWRQGPGRGMLIDREVSQQPVGSPYSSRGRFFSPYLKDEKTIAAGSWRFGNANDAHIRLLQQNRNKLDGTQTTRRLSVDWIRRPRGLNRRNRLLEVGVHATSHLVNSKLDSRATRLTVRKQDGFSQQWIYDLQGQAGYRRVSGNETGITWLMGATVRRLFSGRSDGSLREARSFGLGSVSDWSTMILIRRSGDVRTTLYAVQPALADGFPVLSGSGEALIIIQRLRWAISQHVTMQALTRVDHRQDEPRWSVRTSILLRARLD